MKQVTNTVLMIRPVNFRMNEQTAVNNYFQEDLHLKNKEINERAQKEFDEFVSKLRSVGITVIVVDDRLETDTPDSVFPNNWVSFHDDGTVAIYPMFAENRRQERREDIFDILEEHGFLIKNIVDYTSAEEENIFLEATGSLCLDGINQKAYCALSPRADEDLCIEFCEDFEYTPILFTAYQTVDGKRLPIYHTNVMMCIGNTFAVVCLSTIDDKKERNNVVKNLKEDGKEIIDISEDQMNNFAGNMLQLKGKNDASYIVMSQAAYNSLTNSQIERLKVHGNILYSPLDTIETCGGGSARCMLAEVFLPKN
ncbi:arginine deiminase-related protein [Yeosuana sp. MJ-SS3]|uniref:Arginine deiminase-related protein n=1 Tax=Gilvirhabdus luticola TaxID=3079858 RepID=A0ABU3U6B9_9FLAO|nr:arginine deiminase-related protein [Yeosuana sp. MJ-SS3]MDU8885943.1 arginine deiminase-related protein [Yeosuana sp. MJ-SS3]